MNNFLFDIGFVFYDEIDNISLYKPKFWEENDNGFCMVTILDIQNNLEDTLKYYQSLFSIIKKLKNKRIDEFIQLRPGIFYQGEVAFTFSRYDKLIDIKRFFETLKDPEDSEFVFFDADQGRVFQIVQDKEYFYIVESADEELNLDLSDFLNKLDSTQDFIIEIDPENPERVLNTWAKIKKTDLIATIEDKLGMTQNIISQLSQYFGIDYWNDY